jgi:hypothetical protein
MSSRLSFSLNVSINLFVNMLSNLADIISCGLKNSLRPNKNVQEMLVTVTLIYFIDVLMSSSVSVNSVHGYTNNNGNAC